MVYQNKFVATIKVNGKILREREGNEVFLPFGSEYSILLKNLNSKTAKVFVSIDGEDVLDDKSLIIYPNSYTELKGKLKGTTAKNRFKFIEKTREISEYRGDRVDDGFIRIEVFFEKDAINYYTINDCIYINPYKPFWGSSKVTYNDNSDFTIHRFTSSCNNTINCSNSSGEVQEGITVKGSEVNQDFNYAGYYNFEDMSEVIVLKLRGTKSNDVKVRKPLVVKKNLICETCGRSNKSSHKFCFNCGTYLE